MPDEGSDAALGTMILLQDAFKVLPGRGKLQALLTHGSHIAADLLVYPMRFLAARLVTLRLADDLSGRSSDTASADQSLEPVAAFPLLSQKCGSLYAGKRVLPSWSRCSPILLFVKLDEPLFQVFCVVGEYAARTLVVLI